MRTASADRKTITMQDGNGDGANDRPNDRDSGERRGGRRCAPQSNGSLLDKTVTTTAPTACVTTQFDANADSVFDLTRTT